MSFSRSLITYPNIRRKKDAAFIQQASMEEESQLKLFIRGRNISFIKWLGGDSMQFLSLFVFLCLYFVTGIVKLFFFSKKIKLLYMCSIEDMNEFDQIIMFVLCKQIC